MLLGALRRAAPRAAVGGAVFASGAGLYASCDRTAPPAGLDPKSWKPLTLVKVTSLSSNTAIYRFAFDDKDATSGMGVASCLMTKAAIGSVKEDGSRANVIRPYTPISRPDEKGHVELAVKTYPNGKMSKHMASLKVGDKLDFKGPILKRAYKPNEHKEIGMVAGGTGIAPMLQVIDEVLSNKEDKTKVKLIFANISKHDILLKSRLDARAKSHPDKFEVYYVVDKDQRHWSTNWLQEPWKGGVGYITPDMLQANLPPPSGDSMVYVCGPPPMYKAICGSKGTPEDPKAQGELGGFLKSLGYTSANVFKF